MGNEAFHGGSDRTRRVDQPRPKGHVRVFIRDPVRATVDLDLTPVNHDPELWHCHILHVNRDLVLRVTEKSKFPERREKQSSH